MRRNQSSGRSRSALRLRCAVVVAVATVAVLVPASCGVEVGEHPPPGVPPPVPDDWHHITLCSDDGPVTLDVPSPMEFDGPRAPANITAPATVTYSWGYSPDRVIRYDAFVFSDVDHYGDTDRSIARKVLRNVNADPDLVRFRSMEDRDGHAVGGYDERFDERDYRFRFVSTGGTVVAVGVAVHDGTAPNRVQQATAQLRLMWSTLEVAGLDGAPTGRCDGPSDETD